MVSAVLAHGTLQPPQVRQALSSLWKQLVAHLTSGNSLISNIMSEIPYANRELDEKFKNLDSLIREKHDDTMIKVNEVIVQTTKTNGRVRWLEKMIWLAIGGLGVMTVLVIPGLLEYIKLWHTN